MKKFYGTGVALVTPFSEDGSIDTSSLESLVEHCVANGNDYLVVLGTTAETATLSEAEKILVTNIVVKANKGRLPIVLGVGGNHTQAVLDSLSEIDFEGIQAVLSVTPYYNRPSQEGVYRHFKTISEQCPVPVIIYNVPSRTGVNMLPETVSRLAAECPNIIGVKEAKGDMVQTHQIIQQTPEDFLVISGDDATALPLVLAGGAGVISVIGQGLASDFSQMIRFGLQRNVADAYAIHYKLMHAIDLIFEEGNPAGIKSMLCQLGVIKNKSVRLPLVEASKGLHQKIGSNLNRMASLLKLA